MTTAISPRARVRVATVDASGQALNDYVATWPLTDPAPPVPWAVTLTDTHGRFRLLVFDLDVKTDPADAARDGEVLREHLTAAGIEHVVCCSGSRGGRHIWVALSEPADEVLVRDLGRQYLPQPGPHSSAQLRHRLLPPPRGPAPRRQHLHRAAR